MNLFRTLLLGTSTTNNNYIKRVVACGLIGSERKSVESILVSVFDANPFNQDFPHDNVEPIHRIPYRAYCTLWTLS